ncbi:MULTISPECIES: AraC family transcriptional regulator [Shewanella]|uniref:AraC family transcriptional regulator n=1 Tax=Shewanella TaxID=22 RepID=UPI001D14D547|nr:MULTISPECIES: helix-turn-helix transcriptional regulator [Shewanella]
MAILNSDCAAEVLASLDDFEAQVVGIASGVGNYDSGVHSHKKAQLLYAPTGCITIALEQMQYVLPPTKAAWIPAGIEHCARMQMREVVTCRSLYFDTASFIDLPDKIKIIGVNDLFKQLIERMSLWPWDMPAEQQKNLLSLFIEELLVAPEEMLPLPIPDDPRLKPWLAQVMSGETLPQPLNQMAKRIGASEKTISRIFIRQTGMPYQAWRQQWRLHGAIVRLAEGRSISEVAFSLDFSSDSAFISFFRQHMGETPNRFINA